MNPGQDLGFLDKAQAKTVESRVTVVSSADDWFEC